MQSSPPSKAEAYVGPGHPCRQWCGRLCCRARNVFAVAIPLNVFLGSWPVFTSVASEGRESLRGCGHKSSLSARGENPRPRLYVRPTPTDLSSVYGQVGREVCVNGSLRPLYRRSVRPAIGVGPRVYLAHRRGPTALLGRLRAVRQEEGKPLLTAAIASWRTSRSPRGRR